VLEIAVEQVNNQSIMTTANVVTLNRPRTIHTIQTPLNPSLNASIVPGITQAQLSNQLGNNFNVIHPDSLIARPSWTAVHGQVYDISSFLSQHPGGDVIRLAAGRDASALIESYHSKESMKRVYSALTNKCHLIGPYIEGPPKASAAFAPRLSASQANNPAFFHTVQSRVDELLKSKGWDHHTFESVSVAESIITLLLYFVMVYYSCIQGSWLAAVVVGVLTGRMGFLMHTGNHCASSSSRVCNQLIGLFMNVIGSSHLIWQHEHQVAHHLDPNELEKDNDCAIGNPFIRMHPHLKHGKWQRFQHITVPIAISFGFVKWYFSDFAHFLKGYVGSVRFAVPIDQWCLLLAFKIVFTFIRVVCPIMYFSPFWAFLIIMTPLSVGAHYLENIFIVNHIQHGLVPATNAHWAVKQVMGTSNWGSRSILMNFISGGLNHQIEHHLFPAMNIYLYPFISEVVEKTCKEFDLPYNNYETFAEAYVDMISYLKAMGQESFTPQSFKSTLQLKNEARVPTKGVRVGTKKSS